ncbi:MAG: DUF2062 domain-containing protein [Alphaproteobacteria bacterium]|nr:DUF2062 domain-containing protein [Alphaproteobacteria bacterium]
MPKQYSFFSNIARLVKMKLVIPLLRSSHPADFKARGVAVGMGWAMTPLVGIQMTLVMMTWVFFKKVLKKDFSIPLALAYTWVTNVFTMLPIYYIFYVSGQLMLGHWDDISGYTQLQEILRDTFMSELSFSEKWLLFFKLLLQDWGLAMIVGCLPWVVAGAWVGYVLTMKFEHLRAERKKERLLAKGKA